MLIAAFGDNSFRDRRATLAVALERTVGQGPPEPSRLGPGLGPASGYARPKEGSLSHLTVNCPIPW